MHVATMMPATTADDKVYQAFLRPDGVCLIVEEEFDDGAVGCGIVDRANPLFPFGYEEVTPAELADYTSLGSLTDLVRAAATAGWL